MKNIIKEPIIPLNIKSWAEEDRPREKFQLKGGNALSDAELIAILIGSGSRSMSAVDLAKLILKNVNNDLEKLTKLTIKDLTKLKGMGEAKAITIAAALELGKRRKEQITEERPKLNSPKLIYNYMLPFFYDLQHEEFWLLILDRQLKPIKKVQISKGGIAGTVVDIKIILKLALENLASYIIVMHNHPSGSLNPSSEDIKITNKLKAACQTLDILFADHIIFTNNGFYSFEDESVYTI
ncbi:MAG: DNA repair protein RadC [Cytophagales bacterium]|nr:MAG: DNA repair protein RadC [Cytophagales bacterium]